ncbi:GNAT family N-acetyltransferase [Actinoplanes sp. NBRC 103695]|uniref:GNAT family N-acetyltransferase n=1 Tax=Actinoplanes sp. NBRC 103695 TaxID=3032202 RepID=UPI0024A4BCFF|nr:GNAT family N-acetyltransferase [Actinoplanes sp. NBRC 103695]GLY96052.1 N-acetyltransferase [Actinoplanes sp. NBRC 103695]
MIDVRRAGPDDADELMTLRTVLMGALWGSADAGAWMTSGADLLRARLPGSRMAAFVVDRPAGGGIAACAVGEIDQRLPGPRDPTGLRGYIYNVATLEDHRRRGYSRACMEALLRWFDEEGVGAVDLRASPDGEKLYTALGFRRTEHPHMRRHSPR